MDSENRTRVAIMKLSFAARASALAPLGLGAFLILGLAFVRPCFALDEVNLHISAGVSGNSLLYKFAREKGFYREEGLEVRPIQAGMLPGIHGPRVKLWS
jgi:ABC-type nitrate/sulfonate/bicarbonate transport system substrate-binding protein